jgi:hypothetical protein
LLRSAGAMATEERATSPAVPSAPQTIFSWRRGGHKRNGEKAEATSSLGVLNDKLTMDVPGKP